MTTHNGNSEHQLEAQRRKRAQLAKEKYRRLLGNRSGETAASDSGLSHEKPPHWGDQLFTRPDRG